MLLLRYLKSAVQIQSGPRSVCVGRFFVATRLLFLLVRDFRLLSGADDFVDGFRADFEQAGHFCNWMTICD